MLIRTLYLTSLIYCKNSPLFSGQPGYNYSMKTSVTALYKQYVEVFPQEVTVLQVLCRQLEARGETGILSRKTFDAGHVTACTIVVSLPGKKVLLIDHAALRKTLQPGGHIEPDDDSTLAAAYRECQEEAGLPADVLKYIPLSGQNPELPFNIGVYRIPANSSKDEPQHYHYDFAYLFTVPDGTEVQGNDLEATNPQWVKFVTFAQNTDFSQVAEKVQKLLATA